MSKGIQIIDPEERFSLEIEGATIHMRRLDSSALLGLEGLLGAGTDKSKFNEEVLDYVLVDWEGVTTPLGDVAVPCTRENKLALPAYIKAQVLQASQWARAEMPPAGKSN